MLVILTLAQSWAPFDWNPLRRVDNGAHRIDVGVRFSSAGMMRMDPADWLSLALESHEPVHIELEFRPAHAASDQASCLLAIVPRSGPNGRIVVVLEQSRCFLRLFGAPGDWRFCFVECARAADRTSRLALDLAPVSRDGDEYEASVSVFGTGGGIEFEDSFWGRLDHHRVGCELVLGNDVYGDRPFLGDMVSATATVRGRTRDLLGPDATVIPSEYWHVPRRQHIRVESWGATEALYLHIAYALWMAYVAVAICLVLQRRQLTRALISSATLALLAELGQLGLDGRECLVSELSAGLIGAACGSLFGSRLATRPRSKRCAAIRHAILSKPARSLHGDGMAPRHR